MVLRETKIYKAATAVYDALLKLEIAPRDARSIVVDYATILYATAKEWRIRINNLIEFADLPDSVGAIATSPLDDFDWQGESPLVLSQIYESCIDPDRRKKFGAIYTPLPIVLFMVRSTVSLALKTNCDPSVGEILWDSLRLDEIAAEGSIDRLREGQKALARIRAVDPCCGCGNFLYVMFQELVTIDRAIVCRLQELGQDAETKVSIGQIYGVDIDSDAIEVSKRVMQFAYLELGWSDPVYRCAIPNNFRQGNALGSAEVTDFAFAG